MATNQTEYEILISNNSQPIDGADYPLVVKIKKTNMIVLLVGSSLLSFFGIPGKIKVYSLPIADP